MAAAERPVDLSTLPPLPYDITKRIADIRGVEPYLLEAALDPSITVRETGRLAPIAKHYQDEEGNFHADYPRNSIIPAAMLTHDLSLSVVTLHNGYESWPQEYEDYSPNSFGPYPQSDMANPMLPRNVALKSAYLTPEQYDVYSYFCSDNDRAPLRMPFALDAINDIRLKCENHAAFISTMEAMEINALFDEDETLPAFEKRVTYRYDEEFRNNIEKYPHQTWPQYIVPTLTQHGTMHQPLCGPIYIRAFWYHKATGAAFIRRPEKADVLRVDELIKKRIATGGLESF